MNAKFLLRIPFLVMFAGFTLSVVTLLALAEPPIKEGNPGIPGLFNDLTVTIESQKTTIDEQEAEFTELMEKIASLKATIKEQDAIIEENEMLIDELLEIPPAPVPKTGHIGDCWNLRYITHPVNNGMYEQVDCAGTGQDGEFLAGIEPPNPRFTDNGDGTVTDNMTGLIWLRFATCIEEGLWEDAMAAVSSLREFQCELTDGSKAGDWRAANIKELQSLIDYGGSGLPAGHPFVTNEHWSLVEDRAFWSSTDKIRNLYYPNEAYYVSFWSGHTVSERKHVTDPYNYPEDIGLTLSAWPVRGGQ